MRIVLDANVLASGVVGLPRVESTPGELLRRWFAGGFELVISDVVLTEVGRTLTKRYFVQRVPLAERERAMEVLHRRESLVPITEQIQGVATHPEDDLVLATAVSATADILVTGDKQLQALGRYQGVVILSPREFLALLERTTAVKQEEITS